ncbi:MAG: hypothetical protein JJ850_16515 [Kordiimonadaceae bacterium]|nr:hypothetical protein [Kordiimonadaceae bacterium]MBO6569693.1 hypothetical protein [Kordiimonadaceae bacterium]MBO6966228.1 hypothetical protein [Kordiimonadaceae bacterium]
MSEDKAPEPMAQLYDRFLNRSAIGMFLLALLFALTAFEQSAAGELPGALKYAEKAIAILIIILVGPITFQVYRRKRSFVSTCDEPEGFLTSSFQKAAMRAFTGSFILLIVLNVLLEKEAVDWPAAVIVPALLAFNLGVASLSFFLDNLEDDEDDFAEEEDA